MISHLQMRKLRLKRSQLESGRAGSEAFFKASHFAASFPGAGPWCDSSKLTDSQDSPLSVSGLCLQAPPYGLLGVHLVQGFSKSRVQSPGGFLRDLPEAEGQNYFLQQH